MIVADHRQHATVRRGPIGIAVAQCVAGPVYTGPLAIPDREHAIDPGFGIALHLLRAEHGSRTQLFIDGGQKADSIGIEQRLHLPQLLVVGAERRAAITADEAAGIEPCRVVERGLHQWQTHQRLGAGEEDLAANGLEIVGETVIVIHRRHRRGRSHGERVHGRVSCCGPAHCPQRAALLL